MIVCRIRRKRDTEKGKDQEFYWTGINKCNKCTAGDIPCGLAAGNLQYTENRIQNYQGITLKSKLPPTLQSCSIAALFPAPRLFFLALVLSGFSPKTCLADSRSIINENKSSVVVIYTYNKDGGQIAQANGFIAERDGVVVTNYHIISNADRIKVKAARYRVLVGSFSDKAKALKTFRVILKRKVEGSHIQVLKKWLLRLFRL
jgi:S1-C subfamily serine protease